MDTIIDLRKKIHAFIDKADMRILKIFNAIISTEEVDERTELVKKISAARQEKKAGTLKTVNPENIWESIS